MVIGGCMKEVSELYNDLPVKVNSDDVEKFCDIVLDKEIEGNSNQKVVAFLDTIHEHIYNFLIFSTGDKILKLRVIEKYREQLEKSIKIALLTQAKYLINSGNIELFNGVIKTVNGVDVKESADIIEKVLAPTVINILGGTKPNILYAGK